MSISGRNSTPRMSVSSSTNSFSALKSPGPPKSRSERLERQTNFKVVIRVRPPLPRELNGDIPFENIIAIDDREQCITVSKNLDQVIDEDGQVVANPGPYSTHSFVFDYVYGQNSTQKKVYETTARSVVDSSLQGYNATIFAYGQTGTGKTYTMEGFNREGSVEARGIIPRAIEQIFGHIQRHASPRMRFLVRASYLQIYNEQISDLLKPERNNLTIREDKKKGVFVDQLSEWVVRSPAEIYGLMERGGAVRATGETKMNEISSRSHAVFIVIAEQSETVYVDDNGVEMSPEEFQKFMHQRGVRREQEMNKLEDHVRQSFKVGKLNLVDLAGSERVRLSGATGVRLEECKQINTSLSHLGFVISALTDPKNRQHIPYRNSKLTRMLEDSLGGNCKTTMMAMISPAFESMLETISTLKFANRAKNIRNEARVNEDLDQKSLLRKYERELKQLRAELEERSKNVVDKRKLLELDDMRRRAEADKMAAIRELEKRSQEFMREKEEKKKLEVRIASLMGQMIRGDRHHGDFSEASHGQQSRDGGEGEIMMKEQQDQLRQEYESKLAGLERERETIEEEKAQVDRYKQLLLKQRDIMIALTQRLVERDEQIISLQDELDAYDRHHKELEEKLDEKTLLLKEYERISYEQGDEASPFKNVRPSGGGSYKNPAAETRTGATELIAEDDESSAANSTSVSPVPGSAATDDKVKSLNNMVSNQRMQIANLELQVEENKMNAGKLETNLQNELENQLRMIQFDPARSQLKEPLIAIVNQVIKKVSNGTSSSGAPSPNPSAANDKEIQALRNENAALKAQNRQLETRSRESPADTGVLQSKCETLIKDRDAVQTILEHKIKVLVQSVAQGANAVVNSTPGGGNSGLGQALSKDVAALQRLVNASIAALRNAAATTTLESPLPTPNSGSVSANGSGKFSDPAYGGSGGFSGSANGNGSSGRTYTSTGPQMVNDPSSASSGSNGYGSSGSGFSRVPIATPGYRGPVASLNNGGVPTGGGGYVVNGGGGSGRY